jgi:hypothetical protein
MGLSASCLRVVERRFGPSYAPGMQRPVAHQPQNGSRVQLVWLVRRPHVESSSATSPTTIVACPHKIRTSARGPIGPNGYSKKKSLVLTFSALRLAGSESGARWRHPLESATRRAKCEKRARSPRRGTSGPSSFFFWPALPKGAAARRCSGTAGGAAATAAGLGFKNLVGSPAAPALLVSCSLALTCTRVLSTLQVGGKAHFACKPII